MMRKFLEIENRIQRKFGYVKHQIFISIMKINILLSIFVFACCSLHDTESYNVKINTDSDNYSLDSTTTIGVIVENKSDVDIYYICTCQIHLEEIETGEVKKTWMVHGFEECLAAIPIESSARDTFDIIISNDLYESLLHEGRFDDSVAYRLNFDLYNNKTFDELIDKDDRLSNQINIIK